MKKLLFMVLLFALLVCAACGKDQEAVVSDTDLHTQVTQPTYDPSVSEPLSTVSSDTQLSQLEALLGGTIAFPAAYQVDRYSVVDDYAAQLQFPWNNGTCICRIALGQHDNMSGYTKAFDNQETVEVDGLSVALRYNDSTAKVTIGVADAYDSEQDVSYMVCMTAGADAIQLTRIMESLVGSFTLNTDADKAN